MRWSYLLSRLGILLVIWLVCLFATDPLLRWGLVKAAESAAGAKTDIAKVRTKFFPPSVSVYGVAVGDKNEPYKNVLEFKELKLAFQGRPLLEKKFIVTEAGLSGLKFGTARKTSARLPKQPETFMSRKMAALSASSKEFSLERVSAMKSGGIEMANAKVDSLKTPKLAAELKAKMETDSAQWKTRIETANYPARVQALKDRAEALKKSNDTVKIISETADLLKEAGKLKDEADQLARDAAASVAAAKGSVKQLDDARKADIDTVMANLKVPALDTKSIASYLLGTAITGKTDTALRWYGVARKYVPENTAKAANTARVKRGTVVEFPKEKNYPSFVIEKLFIDGEIAAGSTGSFKYSGTAQGITTQPKIYGKPMTFNATGASGPRKFEAAAVMDRTVSPSSDSGSILLAGFPMQEFKGGSPSGIEVSASGGTGSVSGSAKVVDGIIDSTILLKVDGIQFTASMPASSTAMEIVSAAIKTSLDRMKTLEVAVHLTGSWDNPDIGIESNLAGEISKGLNQFIGKEVEKYKQQAAAEVDKYQAQARAELEKQTAQLQAQLDSQLAPVRKNIDGIMGDLKSKSPVPGVNLPKINLPKISF